MSVTMQIVVSFIGAFAVCVIAGAKGRGVVRWYFFGLALPCIALLVILTRRSLRMEASQRRVARTVGARPQLAMV